MHLDTSGPGGIVFVTSDWTRISTVGQQEQELNMNLCSNPVARILVTLMIIFERIMRGIMLSLTPYRARDLPLT